MCDAENGLTTTDQSTKQGGGFAIVFVMGILSPSLFVRLIGLH